MGHATLKFPRLIHSAVCVLGLSCQRLQLIIIRNTESRHVRSGGGSGPGFQINFS